MEKLPKLKPGQHVFIAGAAGFLGSHLVDRVLAQGCTVTGADNLHTGRISNLTHLKTDQRFSFVEHDVVTPKDIKADIIFNLACPASPRHYQADPIRSMKTSVFGTLNLLEAAQKSGARFVQASTSEVYGDPLEHPQRESYWGHVNPIGIRACYDEGKRAAETLCFDFHRTVGLDIKVARIFNTYGPRMQPDDGRAVSNFVMQALEGKPLTIYGDGSQTRSFCFVDDLVGGLVALAASPEGVTGPVNMGNPTEFELIELANLVLQLTKSNSNIIHLPLPSDDPKQRRPDIGRAWEMLGWKPNVELQEGLEKTIAFFRAGLNASV